jgi:hypothetical protein
LGRYCPRFGRHQVVTIPIQRPAKWMPEDDYKLMLSFDCTFLTWLLRYLGCDADFVSIVYTVG